MKPQGCEENSVRIDSAFPRVLRGRRFWLVDSPHGVTCMHSCRVGSRKTMLAWEAGLETGQSWKWKTWTRRDAARWRWQRPEAAQSHRRPTDSAGATRSRQGHYDRQPG